MKIPAIMPNDQLAVKLAISTCIDLDAQLGCRLVWMKNTLHLDAFYVTEALLPEVTANPAMKVTGEEFLPEFNEKGNISWIQN